MFHVLEKDVAVLKAEAVKIFCDTRTPREAIPLKKFVQFYEQKKLNTDRCCKGCFRRAVTYARQLD